jgi:prepilin-type N-terminal cleavage/methylation domain-containing protein
LGRRSRRAAAESPFCYVSGCGNLLETVRCSDRIATRGHRSGRPARRAAFTLIELLVVIGLIALLIGILLPTLAAIRRSGDNLRCLSNLRQIGASFHQYAAENRGVLPDPATAQMSWENILLPEMARATVFRCPADQEFFTTVGSSYDWRDTGEPLSTLAGQKLTIARSGAVLAFDALPGFHAKRKMNACLVDGSARTMEERDCLEDLSLPVRQAGMEPATSGKVKP